MALRLTLTRLGPLAARPAAAAFAPRPLAASSRLLCTAKPAEEAKVEEAKAAEAPPAEEAAPADGAAEEGSSESASAELSALEAKVAELDAQVADKHDQVLRALAEADNARRRAAVDVENAHKFGVSKFAKDLLEVADNLQRAADSVPEELRKSDENPQLKALYEGVVMVDVVLMKTFEKHGLTRIEPLGEKFDPNFHNAMFEAPDPTKEPGTVMHVAAPGYVLHERCIRAAGVGVVSKPPA